MKLNNFLRYYLLLGCGLFISCQNVERNDERLDDTSHKVLEKIKYPKELYDYLDKNRNKRYTDVNDRSYKNFKNFHSKQELSNVNYKSSTGPNKIREMKILKKVYYMPNKNKNENFTPKTVLESELESKEYMKSKSSKHFNKNHPSNKIKRESPEMCECVGNTETKKGMSSADKFLNLDKKERKRLLEKVFNEINRKLNRPEPGNGNDDKSVEVKPQLLILNSKSKPKRNENTETDHSIRKAVENVYSSKTYPSTPSGSFNDAIKTDIFPDLKANPGISSIGKQTGRSNVNTEQLTTNSKNFSKREDTQYQTDGEHLTTFMPEANQQKPSMEEPTQMRRVQENKSEVNNKDEITTDQSGKIVKKRNKDGQPHLYHVLKNPLEHNKLGPTEGSSDLSKMSERTSSNYGEDSELMEFIRNKVENCLQEIKKDVKEEKEKSEAKEENYREETTSDTKENYPKEISPQLTEQPSPFDKLKNLNPNSPGFQLLWNILQSTPSKPNILLGENQKAHADNVRGYKSTLIGEENYLDEASSEENGNDPYDLILETELKDLDEFALAYTKPNMGATRFDRLWGTDLLDELFF